MEDKDKTVKKLLEILIANNISGMVHTDRPEAKNHYIQLNSTNTMERALTLARHHGFLQAKENGKSRKMILLPNINATTKKKENVKKQPKAKLSQARVKALLREFRKS